MSKITEVAELVEKGKAKLVGAAVVAHIHDEVQVIAPHRAVQNALAVPRREPGTAAANPVGGEVHACLLCPAHQMRLDFVRQLLSAV